MMRFSPNSSNCQTSTSDLCLFSLWLLLFQKDSIVFLKGKSYQVALLKLASILGKAPNVLVCCSQPFEALENSPGTKGVRTEQLKRQGYRDVGSACPSSFLPYPSVPQAYGATYRSSQNNHLISWLEHLLLLYLQCPSCSLTSCHLTDSHSPTL